MYSRADASDQPCDPECLQGVVAHLLIKNQTMRFELHTVHQKLKCIERLFFGNESQQLQRLVPSDVLLDLRNLCKTADSRCAS
jgi:hypothetical protein